MTFSKFSSLPLVFLALCASFSDCASPSPSFPLTLPLMVIYLVGKGFAFSPERSTTGRRQEEEKKKKERRKNGSLRKRGGGGKERAQMGEKNRKYIIGVGLPGDTDSPSHSPSQL